MPLSNVRLGALAVLLATAIAPASAFRHRQDLGYFPGYDMGTLMMNEATRSATLGQPGTTSGSTGGTGKSSGKPGVKSAGSQSAKILRYTPSTARTQTNVAAFAGKMEASDPGGAAEMKRLFATTDVMGAFEGEMRKMGMTKNDIADSYAVWWTSAWLATQGRNDTPTKAQIAGVRAQAAAAMLGAPKIAKLTDAQKQEFSEALLIQDMLVDASVDAAKDDAEAMRRLKAAVAEGAKATGLDLSAMTLTDGGFRPVGAR